MSTFLINHALSHVWCAPRMDLQSIIEPARICPKEGVWNVVKIIWSTYALPTKKERYYVYQIGRLHPALMGLLDSTGQWKSFSDACVATNMMVDIYNDAGLQLPKFQSYYMVTEDRSLVVAIKDQRDRIFSLENNNIYIRVYSNAYYNSLRDDPDAKTLRFTGSIPFNTNDILKLQMKYDAAKAGDGNVICHINGRYVDRLDLLNAKVGDVIEFVHDSSIIRTVAYKVSDLRTFNSLLDNKKKYLLHYSGVSSDDIDYLDDIDFYLMMPDNFGRMSGIYLHKNDKEFVRMVTHRDYSLGVTTLQAFITGQQQWLDTSKLMIMAFIRKGGWNRSLIMENNRIDELYKLNDADLLAAMLGVNSNVINWRADTLENSAYAAIMRAEQMILDQKIVEDAYGYDAIASLVGATPKKVQIHSQQKEVSVPYGLRKNSTVYEYDNNGQLLGWQTHLLGDNYVCMNELCDMVEQLVGIGDIGIDVVYDRDIQVIDPNYSYRMYTRDITGVNPNAKWIDVTNNGGAYAISDGVLRWAVDPSTTSTMVRSNRLFLAYRTLYSITSGVLSFSLVERVNRHGRIAEQVMEVPLGLLEIFLNKRKLIEGLDYFVVFPKVIITNKKYLVDADKKPQQIDIRFTGFCDADFNRQIPAEFGFIEHGVLSKNNKFDIRDGRVQHISIDGCLYDKSELKFAETDPMIQVVDAKNGDPYTIQDILVPFRELTLQSTTELHARSMVINDAISKYMTQRLPEPAAVGPSAIEAKYPVVSPFVSRIISDMKDGILWDDRLKQQYATDLVRKLCQPYEWLLAFDPIASDNSPDPQYVGVHPHPWPFVVDLTIYQYKFVRMVIDYYMAGQVDLSNFARVNGM